jgi:hypothetical protein
MRSERVLWRVGAMHGALLSALLLALALCGHPLRGALLGGSLIGVSFATFWMVAHALTNPARRKLAIVLGVTKISLYLGLSAAVLSGQVVADADGFALGVSCFLLAILTVVFASYASPSIDREASA